MYAQPEDVRKVVAPDGNYSGTAASLDDDQLAAEIQRSENLVDSYTGTRFLDSNVPSLIRDLSVAIGAYYATLIYRKGHSLEPTNPIALRYADARVTLTAIKNGQLNWEPGAPDSDTTPTRLRPRVHNTTPDNARLFGLDDVGLQVSRVDNERYRNGR